MGKQSQELDQAWDELSDTLEAAGRHAIDDNGELIGVIAHEDPRVSNGLDCFSHRAGYITYRWILADKNPISRAVQVKFVESSPISPQTISRSTTKGAGSNSKNESVVSTRA